MSIDYRRVCCTCLSVDRKLFLLCRTPGGVNLLYFLLMYDADAYKEGFFKDPASWLVCWECCAIFRRIHKFRLQTCTAMKCFNDIDKNKKEVITSQCLSHLSTYVTPPTVIETDFVDCGLDINKIKKESIDLFKDSHSYGEETFTHEEINKSRTKIIKRKENALISNENVINSVRIMNTNKKKYKEQKEKTRNSKKQFYTTTEMDKQEFKKVIETRRLDLKSISKCDSCVLEFKNHFELNTHNLEFHSKKENHIICRICLAYIKYDTLSAHTRNHYKIYMCKLCDHKEYVHEQILRHLQEIHKKPARKKKLVKKAIKSNVTSKYPCSECDMIFPNKGAKWKHVQKLHRAGHKCNTCQKVFAFKHNLQRHQLNHTGPHPRSECPQCHKKVRTSQLPIHIRTHTARPRVVCAPCGKAFVCRATYETHLKYASAHTVIDVFRHACTQCDKKYRSRGELRDHVAYIHDAQPRHKCPVCDKLLATRRCVTRHVRRAHDGIKENERDKMCHYCGKAFRDKKSLVEHVSRHTGERPHACGRCGRTFRQKAALYVHSRRLHREDST